MCSFERAAMAKRKPRELAHIVFLLPNFLGFLIFTVFPVLLSFWMLFFNWSLKPSIAREFVGLRNLRDLLGVRALTEGNPTVLAGYVVLAAGLVLGLIGTLWANVSQWRGVRLGGALLVLLSVGILSVAAAGGGGQRGYLGGAVGLICGLAVVSRDEGGWRPGAGTVPVVLLLVAVVGLWRLDGPMWASYEPRDARFWQYLYNTVFLMIGIPFCIAGSLALALLLNKELPLGRWRVRLVGAVLCLFCGIVTLVLVWGLGSPNLGLLGGIFWLMAALGVGFNVVAFRTIFYLPTFTAGVALMILWKALYNSQTGPINMGLEAVFGVFNLSLQPPLWLASVTWAKPALIIMGIWTGIGGMNMLLYLAGLTNVPKGLLDAAEVDGAGWWARFRHVIWPQLAPTTFFISVMSIIGGFQGGFEQARVMTGGGPAGSTTTMSYYIYNRAFEDLEMGYAAAISWVLFGIIFVATLINWKFGKSVEVD